MGVGEDGVGEQPQRPGGRLLAFRDEAAQIVLYAEELDGPLVDLYDAVFFSSRSAGSVIKPASM